MASVVGIMGNAGQANYAASKAGLIGMTKSVAREVAAIGIRVNAVAPGFIATDMTAAMPEAARDAMCGTIPAGRPGTPEDVAQVVAFLGLRRCELRDGAGSCRRWRHEHVICSTLRGHLAGDLNGSKRTRPQMTHT